MGHFRDPNIVVLWLGLSGTTGQWGHVSGVVLDRDPSVLLPRSGHDLVMIYPIVLSWLDVLGRLYPPVSGEDTRGARVGLAPPPQRPN
jgi:hypothetical protein